MAYVVMLSFGPTLVVEQGASITAAAQAISIMSWVFLFALPMGGWLSTHYKAPNAVMITGLMGSVIFGLARPLVGGPSLMFALFGIAFAIATPAIVSLPAQILRPCNRATGFGIYYIWYYAGSAPLPPVGGFLKDVTGTATAAVLFSASMMFGTGVFALGASGLRDARSVHALYSAARVRKWPLATMHDPCFVVRLSG